MCGAAKDKSGQSTANCTTAIHNEFGSDAIRTRSKNNVGHAKGKDFVAGGNGWVAKGKGRRSIKKRGWCKEGLNQPVFFEIFK
jgi:hypothetical protein